MPGELDPQRERWSACQAPETEGGTLVDAALASVRQARSAWCRFITANDVGRTGSHQAGFYIPKLAAPALFELPSERGQNLHRDVWIRWQGGERVGSRIHYYGQGTRNEHRLTRLGRDFAFLSDEHIGSLLILSRLGETDYEGWVLDADEDIEAFYTALRLPPGASNLLLDPAQALSLDERLDKLLAHYAATLRNFPPSPEMSQRARQLSDQAYHLTPEQAAATPDRSLLRWTQAEWQLFRRLEDRLYTSLLHTPFESVEQFVTAAQAVLNRRKARAGKSLEHHLAALFTARRLRYEAQAMTELGKRPDFLFPGAAEYADLTYPSERLATLAAKTTCKDRWRQALSEADRVSYKYLFTLQQGISAAQLAEMAASGLSLVVPAANVITFPEEGRDRLLTLEGFIQRIAKWQGTGNKEQGTGNREHSVI